MPVNLDLGTITNHPTGFPLNAAEWNSRYSEVRTVFQNETKDLAPRQIVQSFTSGESLNPGDPVRISGATVIKTDNTTSTGIKNFVGFATESVATSSTVRVAVNTVYGLSSLTAGDVYYLGPSGTITNTRPSDNIKAIGVAINTTDIFISSDLESEQAFDILLTSDGTAGAPSRAFASDETTGDFLDSNSYAISVDGVKRFDLAPDGHLELISTGAGEGLKLTSSVGPTIELSDTGESKSFFITATGTGPTFTIDSTDTADIITVTQAGLIGILDPSPSFTFDLNGTFRATGNGYFDSNVEITGNLGLGVTSPTEKLEISGNGRVKGNNALYFADSLTNHGVKSVSTSEFTVMSNGKITFDIAGSEAVVIDSSGNMAIGRSAPSAELHVDGADNPTIRIGKLGDTNDQSSLSFQAGDGLFNSEFDIVYKKNATVDELRFQSGGGSTAQMTVVRETDKGGFKNNEAIHRWAEKNEYVDLGTTPVSLWSLIGGPFMVNFFIESPNGHTSCFSVQAGVQTGSSHRYVHIGGANTTVTESSEGVFDFTILGDAIQYTITITSGSQAGSIKAASTFTGTTTLWFEIVKTV